MFSKEEHDLAYQACNALLKMQGVDAVGMTLKVAALMSKIQGMTEGIEQHEPIAPLPAKRGRKNGKGAEAK